MKLQTSIIPRRNGTINLLGEDGQTYVFQADASGDVVCEIADEPTIIHLLGSRGEFFWPASEEDYAEAKALLDAADVDVDDLDHDGREDDDDLALPPGADPLEEANTPPQVIPGKAKRGRKPKAEAK